MQEGASSRLWHSRLHDEPPPRTTRSVTQETHTLLRTRTPEPNRQSTWPGRGRTLSSSIDKMPRDQPRLSARGLETIVTTCAVAFAGATVYLFRRVRLLEARLTSTAKLHLEALMTLQNTLDEVAHEVVNMKPAEDPPLRAANLSVQLPQPPRVAAASSTSSELTQHDERGYQTADEDVEGEPFPAAVAVAAPRGDATRDSPVRVEDWAARSVMVSGGSWSCVDDSGGSGVACAAGCSSASAECSSASASSSGEDEASAARKAAAAALLVRADSMYESREYEQLSELLGGVLSGGGEEVADILWRRARALKVRNGSPSMSIG